MLDVTASFRDARKSGAGWIARCPAHDDRRSSLSIGTGADGRVLLHCHAGCDLDDILAAAHLEPAHLFPNSTPKPKPTIEAVYAYHDAGGAHVFDVIRYTPKDFRQRRADGTWSMAGVRRVLYRLDTLQGQSTAYVVEGEKDADRLATIGLPGTTSPGGAGKWRLDFAQQLTAAAVEHVVILPDNDDPGRNHARDVAVSCHGAGLQVKIIELPDLPPKGDVSDWLQAHTRADLIALVKATPLWSRETIAEGHASSRDPVSVQSGLALTPIGDLLSEPDEHVDYIVAGCITAGSVNLLSAKPKVGKSTAARHLALEVARGGTWLNRECRQGPAWYLAFEGRRADIREHFRKMGATAGDALRVFTGQAPKTVVPQLAALAVTEGPLIIVVDTMQRFIKAKSTDDYAEMTNLLDEVIALARDSDAAVLLLHHSNKSGRAGIDAVLGSTAICGSMDTVFMMSKSERYRTISTEQRTGEDMPEHIVAMGDDGRVHLAGTRADAERDAMADSLMAVLAESTGPLTQADLEARVEGRTAVKRAALKLIVDRGTVGRSGQGKKADPYLYVRCDSRIHVPYRTWEQEKQELETVSFPKQGCSDSCSHLLTGQGKQETTNTSSEEVPGDGGRF